MLGDAKVDEHGNVYDTKDCNVMYLDKDGEDREINVRLLVLDAMCYFLLVWLFGVFVVLLTFYFVHYYGSQLLAAE